VDRAANTKIGEKVLVRLPPQSTEKGVECGGRGGGVGCGEVQSHRKKKSKGRGRWEAKRGGSGKGVPMRFPLEGITGETGKRGWSLVEGGKLEKGGSGAGRGCEQKKNHNQDPP